MMNNDTTYFIVRCGCHRESIAYEPCMSVVDLFEKIQTLFEILPTKYHLEHYNSKKMKMIRLSDSVVGTDPSSIGAVENSRLIEFAVEENLVKLFVVSDDGDDQSTHGEAIDAQRSISEPNDKLDIDLLSEKSHEVSEPMDNRIHTDDTASPIVFRRSEQDNYGTDHVSFPDNQSEHVVVNGDVSHQQLPITRVSYTVPSEPEEFPSETFKLSRDVHPFQKFNYRSDEFSQRIKEKNNGKIPYLQGQKSSKQKHTSVLPVLTIPRTLFNSIDFILAYAVLEEILQGTRRFYKHPDFGFLPEFYTKDSATVNPIQITLASKGKRSQLEPKLKMVKSWQKLGKREVILDLSEERVKQLHNASHIPEGIRLLFQLPLHNDLMVDPLCLSNFIQSPRSKKTLVRNAVG